MDAQRRYDGRRIGLVLADQGRSQQWLATRLGVSKSYISFVTKGRRTMPEPMCRRVSELLGVSFALLFELPTGSETSADSVSSERVPA